VSPTFRRKNIRLPADHYLGCRRYFVTILCSSRRSLLLGDVARRVIATLREIAQQHHFAIYTYCAMPDHLHFLTIGMSDDCDLLEFVKHFKLCCTLTRGSERKHPLWHKTFYDYVLRDGVDNGSVAQYILLNPVRKGICADPREHEFTGSFVSDWPGVDDPPPWTPPWRG
jgi:putative transposase